METGHNDTSSGYPGIELGIASGNAIGESQRRVRTRLCCQFRMLWYS